MAAALSSPRLRAPIAPTNKRREPLAPSRKRFPSSWGGRVGLVFGRSGAHSMFTLTNPRKERLGQARRRRRRRRLRKTRTQIERKQSGAITFSSQCLRIIVSPKGLPVPRGARRRHLLCSAIPSGRAIKRPRSNCRRTAPARRRRRKMNDRRPARAPRLTAKLFIIQMNNLNQLAPDPKRAHQAPDKVVADDQTMRLEGQRGAIDQTRRRRRVVAPSFARAGATISAQMISAQVEIKDAKIKTSLLKARAGRATS